HRIASARTRRDCICARASRVLAGRSAYGLDVGILAPMRSRAIAACTAVAILSSCGRSMIPPSDISLAILNAKVWTGDPRQPWATGVAISGDKISRVGSSAEISKLILGSPSARVIDAHGAFVTPGFIDSHVHFVAGGFRLSSVQLRDARTQAD